jgi:hypothetical protein
MQDHSYFFLLTLLARTPTWVWAILAVIIVIGLLQARDQQMARARLLILPLLWLAYGAWGVEASFGLAAAPLAAWVAGLLLSLLLARRSGWPGSASFDPASQRFRVPGSWLPMALMLAIFAAKFALGVALAMQPQLARSLPVAAGFALLFGALSGVFLGRSRNILGRAPATLRIASA